MKIVNTCRLLNHIFRTTTDDFSDKYIFNVRLGSDGVKELVNMGPETPMFGPTAKIKVFINVESLKRAKMLIDDEYCGSVEPLHLFSQLRQVRSSPTHCVALSKTFPWTSQTARAQFGQSIVTIRPSKLIL